MYSFSVKILFKIVYKSILMLVLLTGLTLFFYFFLHTNVVVEMIIFLMFFYLPFFLILIQYACYSKKVSLDDEGIVFLNKKIERTQIEKIVMVSTKNRDGYDPAFFYPGGEGLLYYFKFTLKSGTRIYVNSLMDRKMDFEDRLKSFGYVYQYKYRFFAFIV